MRATCELFSWDRIPGKYANRAKRTSGNSERPVHILPENQILTWRIGNQEQARTVADYFPSSVVSTRKTRCHLEAFHGFSRGRFIPGRNAKWNRKFPEFPNFQKKGQPREVNRNFRNYFPETFCTILNRNSRKF